MRISHSTIRFILLGLWLGLIFYFSSQNYDQQSLRPILTKQLAAETIKSELPDWEMKYRHSTFSLHQDPYRFIEFLIRKGAHLTIYAGLAVFAYEALQSMVPRMSMRWLVVLAIVAAAASLDEWNQSRFVRTPAIQDVGIDLTGGVLGLVVCSLATYIVKMQKDR